MNQIVIGLLSYLACNCIWFFGEVQFLKLLKEGNTTQAIIWGALGGLISFPICLFATWTMYKSNGTWIVTQSPSVILNIVISYIAFRGILGTQIGWREIVCACLLLAAALVMSAKPEGT